MVLLKTVAHNLLSCYREARKNQSYGFLYRSSTRSPLQASLYPSISRCSLEGRDSQTIVCDIHGTLLRSPSFFPFFMLVAFEGGSIIRALLLLSSYPLLWLLNNHDEVSLRVLVFITFCGLRKKDMETVARAVLPKFYLENLNLHAYEVLASAGKKVVVTSVPRVMVEGFLKEYLSVDSVVGTELHMVGGYYFTGFLSNSGMSLRQNSVKYLFGDQKPDLGLGSCFNPYDHLFLSLCKESYVVNKVRDGEAEMPRKKYPKPLIFHDGRLAFFPTPTATLALFIWLPFGICLAIYRLFLGRFVPYRIAIILAGYTGVIFRVEGRRATTTTSAASGAEDNDRNNAKHRGVLYVCTHRTLADPVVLCTALQKPLTAVTYSLSKMTELIAPMRTVRLTRDREQDRATMHRLLQEGDLVVCPEGTTCREPYLLRFSPLFAELTDQIVPVGMDVKVDMFYGTTASGFKWLDPFFCLMNPRPVYRVVVLGKVPRELTCAGGLGSYEVANGIQRQLGEALGFECTSLTRKDKYLKLAGNEGVVNRINGLC